MSISEFFALDDYFALWLAATASPGSEVWFQRGSVFLPLHRPLALYEYQARTWRAHTFTATT